MLYEVITEFVNGIKTLDKLQKGSRVLIVEACNHSRIGEDIGIVQIPRILNKIDPGIVITSYSIHYTKLYETLRSSLLHEPVSVATVA